MNKITCPNCGEVKPYSWLGGYHCSADTSLRPEVWRNGALYSTAKRAGWVGGA